MVATGLPIATAAPQAPKAGQADAAGAAAGQSEGGFSDTLMQLLGLAEPAADSPPPVANPLIQALLEGVDEDPAPADTDAAALLAMLPLIQPAELRSAQAVARPGAGSTGPIAATGASLEAAVAVALASAEGAQELKTLLKEAPTEGAQGTAADSPAQSLPSGALQALTQEAVNTGRTVANDSAPRQLHAQVGTPAWSDELGARLQLMAEKGHHAASLRLSPEHLGPLEVQISVQDDQATVWFGASNVDTRAALEQALPRLRELFAAQGMSLAHSGVFQQSPQAQGQAHAASPAGGGSEVAEISESTPITISRRGLLDAYA